MSRSRKHTARSDEVSDWIACIDFGTAYSKVAMVAPKPRDELERSDIVPLPIAKDIARNAYLLPSIVFVTDDAVLFGEKASTEALRAKRISREAFVSPKQYLSTHEEDDLDASLEREIDPSGQFSARSLITLYLAFLLKRAELAARNDGHPWPPRLRIARPAWDRDRAAWGERALREMVCHAVVLSKNVGDELTSSDGIPIREALKALATLPEDPDVDDETIFQISRRGHASVTEATAVGAGAIRPDRRRVVVVADIGGGTSDFAAFMTGLPGRNVVAEVKGSSQVLREAGDFLDMHMRRLLIAKAGLLSDDPAARGAIASLRRRQRNLKETLFKEGTLAEAVGDTFVDLTVEELMQDSMVAAFAKRLQDRFLQAIEPALRVARTYSKRTQIPIEIMPTGGGYDLPMVRRMTTKIPRAWTFVVVEPSYPVSDDHEFRHVVRQLSVAIGGAVKDLPVELPPVSPLRGV